MTNQSAHSRTATGTPARRAVRLEFATLGWNSVEAAIAGASGVLAGSVALMAFGIDSGIEVVSATIVMVRLRALIAGREPDEEKERRALKAVAVCFYALAAYVVIDAAISLTLGDHPTSSPSGIAITAAALIVMPVLAIKKRRTAAPPPVITVWLRCSERTPLKLYFAPSSALPPLSVSASTAPSPGGGQIPSPAWPWPTSPSKKGAKPGKASLVATTGLLQLLTADHLFRSPPTPVNWADNGGATDVTKYGGTNRVGDKVCRYRPPVAVFCSH